MKNTRNILIIGKTGSGKSTLANVITGTNEFRESEYTVSKTKKVQFEDFEHQGIEYRIIDTIGISDTAGEAKMSLDKVLYNLAKVGHTVKDGLSQIWLVTDGKSTEQDIALYNLLKETIFDEDIAQHTTIIRTRFTSFKDENKCSKDREVLFTNNPKFRFVNKIIHVDNPSIHITDEDLETEELLKKINERNREKSREILLNHLTNCQDIYKPENLKNLNLITDEEWKDKEVLRGKITKKFIEYIRKKESKLGDEVKGELEKLWNETEKRINKLEKRELSRTEAEKEKLPYNRLNWGLGVLSQETEKNNSEKIKKQLIEELRDLNLCFSEEDAFIKWNKEINQLEESSLESERIERLAEEITFDYKNIVKSFEERVKEKNNYLQRIKDDIIKKSRGKGKPKLTVGSMSKFFGISEQEENWLQEKLEELCKVQTEILRSEKDLEAVQKALGKIKNYKERLGQNLETHNIIISEKN